MAVPLTDWIRDGVPGSLAWAAIADQLETAAWAEQLPTYFNLRDLGGMTTGEGRTVRDGMLFRGASLHRLEPQHHELIAELEIATAIDLRTGEEVGHGTYSSVGATVHHLPMFAATPTFEEPIEDPATALVDAYLWMLGQAGPAIGAALELLADPESYPAVVYCAAGKDRTGVLIAIVLELLGVGRDQIAGDYARSDAPAQALREWRAALDPSRRDPVPAGIYRAPADALPRFFAALERRHGSLDAYLTDAAVPVEPTRTALRANLLA
jgi:protein-tyrosine phosphatase